MALNFTSKLLAYSRYHPRAIPWFWCERNGCFSHFLHSSITLKPQNHRPYVEVILNCYQIKRECYSSYADVPHYDHSSPHHLVLTARPDEFEKLLPKCQACGIILQTENDHLAGFVPEQKFLDSVKDDTLHKLICFSCFQLRFYNKSIGSRLNAKDVLDQLEHLRRRKALVLYVVDMFDIEGTLFHKILQVVGKKKRVIIVGNKVDRFPQDDKKPANQLESMKDVLKDICYQNGLEDCNFRDICLVSAKSGYGMQSLVAKINKHRDVNMDVYLIGCANTGKLLYIIL